MSHGVVTVPLLVQRVTDSGGRSVRHECDIDAGIEAMGPHR
jgi:hypothetical protein